MKIIVNKLDNVVAMASENVTILPNGYPKVEEINTAYDTSSFNMFDVDGLPDDYATSKYCYSETDGFTPSPLYAKSVYERVSPEDVTIIKNNAIEEVKKNAIN